MNVLGIETATSICGVGVAGVDGFLADYRFLREYSHAERLPVITQNMINDIGLTMDQLDGIAVSIGPGSFTGLRIGLGFAKGLAFGLKKPLIAVPTMDGLAWKMSDLAEWVCALLTARKGEAYQGIYHYSKTGWEMQGSIDVVTQEGIGSNLTDEKIYFVGDCVGSYQDAISKQVKNGRFLPEMLSLPSGYSIAGKGREMLVSGNIENIDTLAPHYIKRFQGVL